MIPKFTHNTGLTKSNWANMWVDWDIVGWIKKQVDQLASADGNTVRCIHDVAGVIGGFHTMKQYLDKQRQLAGRAKQVNRRRVNASRQA